MARLMQCVVLIFGLVSLGLAKPVDNDVKDVELRMPDVQPKVADTYLCTPMGVRGGATYITGFTPHANMDIAHHMLLFGCDEPGSMDSSWNCGEMQSKETKYTAPPCGSSTKIIYAWAMDAPELKLPKDVAFKVGDDTDIKWLVLQVHYKDVSHFLPPESVSDHSGLTLHTTDIPQPKRAGVYLLSTGGEIPPNSTTYMEAACGINDPITIHPFAFRTHAHVHGEVVAGYRVRDGDWEEIGRRSPKDPQMFYNVTHPGITVERGDILAARCTMVNHENRTVEVGQTQKDEMCNFYIMYWVSGDDAMAENYCTTSGPPGWYWNRVSSIHVENSPDSASIIPGTNAILKQTAKFQNQVHGIIQETNEKINDGFLDLLAAMKGDDLMTEQDMLDELPGQNEIPEYNGYDPDKFHRMVYGGYGGNPVDDSMDEWNVIPQDRQQEPQYAPYDDEMGKFYYPQY